MENYEIFFGRVGRFPELRRTQSGEYLCDFSLAVNKGKDTPADWKRIVVWGELAQRCHKKLKRGNEVFVRGRETVKSFQDREGQVKQYREVAVHLVGFINV